MIPALMLFTLMGSGLVAEPEATCSDWPPSDWSFDQVGTDTFDEWAQPTRCLDAAITSDGVLVVAVRGYVYALEDGAWSTVATPAWIGCPQVDAQGTVVRLALTTGDGVAVVTRAAGEWPVTVVAALPGPFALRPDGQLRSVAAGPLGETLQVRDSDAFDDAVVDLPGAGLDGDPTRALALQVDAAGASHVLFQRRPHALEYATDRSGAWVVEVVEPLEFAPPIVAPSIYETTARRVPSLAVDTSGAVHVVYALAPSMKLAHATDASGAWTRRVVDHGSPTGFATTLRLGPDGAPIVLYHQIAQGDLVLAALGVDGWRVSTVDARDTSGQASTLARGPDGRWHAIYSSYVPYPWQTIDAERPLRHAVSNPCASTLPGRR